jgi:hypothetical protein
MGFRRWKNFVHNLRKGMCVPYEITSAMCLYLPCNNSFIKLGLYIMQQEAIYRMNIAAVRFLDRLFL